MATFGTFTDGSVLKATEMNGMFVATTFTPVVRQSGIITNGTVNVARYFQVNKLVMCAVTLSLSSAGSANNRIEIDLPVTAKANSFNVIGSGYYSAVSVVRTLRVVQYSTTRMAFFGEPANSLTAYWGTTAGGGTTIASGHAIGAVIMYEAA
jgi:hypothetical protein